MNDTQHIIPKLAYPQMTTHGYVPIPYFVLPQLPMELYDPQKYPAQGKYPLQAAPQTRLLPLRAAAKAQKNCWLIPRQEECTAIWDKYDMLPNIRRHSDQVALFARGMAEIASSQGANVNPQAVYAAGLLHDLGKSYCILYGGNHAQLGAAWVMHETLNPLLAQAVLFHVHWFWEDSIATCMDHDECFLTLAIIYADKRVKHDSFVSLEERFDDLLARYGRTEAIRYKIRASHEQGKQVEAAFKSRFKVDLNESTFDSGRLVQ